MIASRLRLHTIVTLAISSCILVLALLVRAYAEPASIDLTPAERDWLIAHPIIRLAPDPDFKPIEFFDKGGTYQGAAADHIRLLEEKLGIKFTIVRLKNWDEVIEKFLTHEVDLLGAVASTLERRKFMMFTEPLVQVPGGIFTRTGSDRVLGLTDLKGKRVAVVSNYMAHSYLRTEYPEIPLIVVPDVTTGLTKVSLGEVDAYVENMANATYYLQESGITNLRLAGNTGFAYQWSIGIRSDWPELQGILNKGLAAIGEEEKRRLISRWIHADGNAWRPTGTFIMGTVASCAIISLCLIVIWNQTLRRQVASRTESLQQELEARKRVEEALSKLNNDLAASNRELESFCYTISHDLRAPLRAIDGYTKILLEDYRQCLDADGCKIFDQISTSAVRMGQLIDDLLAFSRVGRVGLDMEKVNMEELCRSVYEEIVPAEDKGRIEFRLTALPVVCGDWTTLRQVWSNLLSNSVKYSSKSPKALIDVGGEQRGNEMVYWVRDNGVGFDMAYVDKLFGIFQRLHGMHEFPGTGVGLAIVDRVIKRHGGRVWAEGAVDQGATFFFALPINPPAV